MLTEDQLADQLRTQLRREVAAIEPSADLLASLRSRRSRRSLALRAAVAAVPVAAVAAAMTMIFSMAPGSTTTAPKSAVLTSAMVKRMASDSRLALARSGRAVISFRLTDKGAANGGGTDTITFAGKNWNDVLFQVYPKGDGLPAHTAVTIDRIVNGKFYLHTEGKDGKVRWFRDTSAAGHPRVSVPDPRSLFGLLNPAARFKVVGHVTAGGIRLTVLRATRHPRLRALGSLPGVAPQSHAERLTVWVDRHHVVHRIFVRAAYDSTTDPIYLKKSANGHLEFLVPSKKYLKQAWAMARKVKGQHATAGVDPSLKGTVRHNHQVAVVSAAFSGFGQPQVIRIPPHATPLFMRG